MWFRNYRNKRIIKKQYKNAIDISCYIPSVKAFLVNLEFYMKQHLEVNRLEAMDQDRALEINARVIEMVRASVIQSLTLAGKLTNIPGYMK